MSDITVWKIIATPELNAKSTMNIPLALYKLRSSEILADGP